MQSRTSHRSVTILKKTDVKGNFYPKINKFVTRGLPHFKKIEGSLVSPLPLTTAKPCQPPRKTMRKMRDNIRLYHVDHLGSTSLVTDIDGEITQHVAYIPYGEVFVEQRNGVWNTPYLFNAKELDEETGLYYYGARYLNPKDTRWLSVDPMFEKYMGMTPYNYCMGNPVGLVDPDGRAVKPFGNFSLELIKWGLTAEESSYVRLDKNGCIDKSYLMKGAKKLTSIGGNYESLLDLVKSEKVVEIHVGDSYETSKGVTVFREVTYESSVLDFMYETDGRLQGLSLEEYQKQNDFSTEKYWSGTFGITVYAENENTAVGKAISGDIQIHMNNSASKYGNEGKRVMTRYVAHELYGHALFRILGKNCSHGKIKSIAPEERNNPNNNWELEMQIYNRENEAEKNFDNH